MRRLKVENEPLSFPQALFLVFLGLKLGSVIDWSWWWIFSPLLIAWFLYFVINTISDLRQK